MTNEKYLNQLLDLTGIKNTEPGILDRKLNITVAGDDYGKPTMTVIAFEGSPPRLEVVFSQYWPDVILVSGRMIRSPEKREELWHFLKEFVETRKAEWNCAVPEHYERA